LCVAAAVIFAQICLLVLPTRVEDLKRLDVHAGDSAKEHLTKVLFELKTTFLQCRDISRRFFELALELDDQQITKADQQSHDALLVTNAFVSTHLLDLELVLLRHLHDAVLVLRLKLLKLGSDHVVLSRACPPTKHRKQ